MIPFWNLFECDRLVLFVPNPEPDFVHILKAVGDVVEHKLCLLFKLAV